MTSSGDCLGICFADQQLFYAVNSPSEPGRLEHIGCIDFSFHILEALSDAQNDSFQGLLGSIAKLRKQFRCSGIRLLSPAIFECWSVCPRLVHETSEEREDHLAVLMGDVPRQELETIWHTLSNRDFKLLMIRNRNLTENYRSLSTGFGQTDFVSEFELGMEWHRHTGIKGSYLTINSQSGYLAIASYLLGKLRGATFIRYDNLNDLPYLWNYHARHLSWMNGFHEQVYLYGNSGLEFAEVMSSFFSETDRIILMNSLADMQVDADETTYGFRLEDSFPAVLLSLNLHEERQPSQQ